MFKNKMSKKCLPYLLIGDNNKDTQIAVEFLDKVQIDYVFIGGDVFDGTLPQLHTGLISYIGLDSIIRMTKNAEYAKNHPYDFKNFKSRH